MTVETRLRAAARELLDAVEAEPAYFGRPSPRSPRRWAAAAVATGIAVLIGLLALSPVLRRSRSVSQTGCPESFTLPFVPTHLPAGWTAVRRHTAHANAGTQFIEVWGLNAPAPSLYGVIEVWRGVGPDAVPTPSPAQTITVLGRPAQIGPISDGWSVTFTTGDPASPCNHWALVGHPQVTEPILLDVAEHLVPER